MQVTAFCDGCHRIRRIHATHSAMLRRALNKPIFGLCDDCYEAEVRASKGRHPAFRRNTDGKRPTDGN